MNFIGRKSELGRLKKEYSRDSSFVVVYGRRRVGKTTLIKEFISDKKALYFLAGEETDRQNLDRFTDKLKDFTGHAVLEGARYEHWRNAFKAFAETYPDEKKVLIIDVFQYLVSGNPAFPSIFQQVWDEILADKNVMVILCGSLISMMTSQVLSHSSPLYGRRTAQIRYTFASRKSSRSGTDASIEPTIIIEPGAQSDPSIDTAELTGAGSSNGSK